MSNGGGKKSSGTKASVRRRPTRRAAAWHPPPRIGSSRSRPKAVAVGQNRHPDGVECVSHAPSLEEGTHATRIERTIHNIIAPRPPRMGNGSRIEDALHSADVELGAKRGRGQRGPSSLRRLLQGALTSSSAAPELTPEMVGRLIVFAPQLRAWWSRPRWPVSSW